MDHISVELSQPHLYVDRTGGVHAQSLVQLLQPVIRSGDLVRPTTESRCCLAELAEG